MTASVSNTLRLWAVDSVGDMKVAKISQKASTGLTMEDEMALDGPITCAEFDDLLDMVVQF